MEAKRSPRKIKQDGKLYRKREKNLRETYAIRVVPCETCGSPRRYEYTCLYCGEE